MRVITFDDIAEEWATRPDMDLGQYTKHLISAALAGSQGLVADWARFPPGFHHHLHRHPHADQIMISLSGRTIVMSGESGDEVEIGPGQLSVHPRGEWHGARNDSDEDATMLVLFIGIDAIAEAGYVEFGERG